MLNVFKFINATILKLQKQTTGNDGIIASYAVSVSHVVTLPEISLQNVVYDILWLIHATCPARYVHMIAIINRLTRVKVYLKKFLVPC